MPIVLNHTVGSLVSLIAIELGPDWISQNNKAGWYANLIRTDGLNLWCSQDAKRMSIMPDPIEAIDEHNFKHSFHHEQPKITVAMDRAPKAIAGSIRSRLLPEAEIWWREAQQWKTKIADLRTGVEAIQRKILDFPGARIGRRDGAKVYGPNWTWTPTSETSSIEFREMPPDIAVALLQTYYQMKTKTEREPPCPTPR